MPAVRVPYPAEVILQARQDYVDGRPVDESVARAHTNTGTFYKWVDGEVPGMNLTRIPRRRPNVRRRWPSKKFRAAVVKRAWLTAEQQAQAVEHRLARNDPASADSERDTRLLGMLIKMLRDVAAMEREEAKPAAKPQPNSNDDDDPRDIDEFRRDLARQMDAIVAARADHAAGEQDVS